MLISKDLCRRYRISRTALSVCMTKQIIPPPLRFSRVQRWREEDLVAAEQRSKPQVGGSNA